MKVRENNSNENIELQKNNLIRNNKTNEDDGRKTLRMIKNVINRPITKGFTA